MSRLLIPLFALTGCDSLTTDCNTMYAPDTAQVELQADSWSDGAWEVEADGETCEITLPGTEAEIVCDGQILSISLNGDGSEINSLMLWESAPESFELVLRQDGVEVFSATVSPTYVEDEPNGEGCGFRSYGVATVDVGAL